MLTEDASFLMFLDESCLLSNSGRPGRSTLGPPKEAGGGIADLLPFFEVVELRWERAFCMGRVASLPVNGLTVADIGAGYEGI